MKMKTIDGKANDLFVMLYCEDILNLYSKYFGVQRKKRVPKEATIELPVPKHD